MPRNPGREAVIVWDAGQFHQRGGRIVALLDLEFGHIGDPLADLAGLWVRNPFIPLGDVAALMRRYQDGSGAVVDIVAVRWHYILRALSNQLEFHAALADPVPGSDYMLNLHWCIETNLMALEAIAAGSGVELEEVEELGPAVSPYGPAYRHLEGLAGRAARRRSRVTIRAAEIGPPGAARRADRRDRRSGGGGRPRRHRQADRLAAGRLGRR